MKRSAETSFNEIDYIFEDPGLDPAELFQQIENRELLFQHVAKLRPIYTEVIALRFTYEYSDLEIRIVGAAQTLFLYRHLPKNRY